MAELVFTELQFHVWLYGRSICLKMIYIYIYIYRVTSKNIVTIYHIVITVYINGYQSDYMIYTVYGYYSHYGSFNHNWGASEVLALQKGCG